MSRRTLVLILSANLNPLSYRSSSTPPTRFARFNNWEQRVGSLPLLAFIFAATAIPIPLILVVIAVPFLLARIAVVALPLGYIALFLAVISPALGVPCAVAALLFSKHRGAAIIAAALHALNIGLIVAAHLILHHQK